MKLSKLFAPKEYTLENGTTVREPRSKDYYYDSASCGDVLRREGHWF